MLERLQRMRNVDGLPTVKPGSATKFFEGLEKNSDRLQSYKGELVIKVADIRLTICTDTDMAFTVP